MRILVVSQYYYPEPFRINEICSALASLGHKITVVTCNPNYPDGKIYKGYENINQEETINGVHIIRAKARPRKTGFVNLALNYLSAYFAIKRRLSSISERFDVVYTYQLSPITSSWPAVRYAKKHKIPCELYCLDLWPESIVNYIGQRNPIFLLIKKFSRTVYQSATEISVTSPSFIDYIKGVCDGDCGEINFRPQHSHDVGMVARQSDDDYLNVMFLGNVGRSQNLELTVKAISLLQKDAKVRFHIVGSGSDLETVKALVKGLAIEDKVIFYGRQPKDRMPEFYKFADVCLVSLKKEGAVSLTIPGKLQEYMSAGKAILGSIDGDASYVVNEAQCGLCSPAEDLDGLVKNINFMIDKKADIQSWGKNARDYYDEHFTLSKHIETLDADLKRLTEV